jgi:glucose-6-phosphate isomerase
MAQLYLGGPHDKFTIFVRVDKNNTNLSVPNMKKYNSLVEGIQGKKLDEIMGAIIEGTQIAFKKGKRPYVEISLPDKSEASISQMLQLMMMTIMYLGSLLNLNPFNQPNVEDYKMETKRLLE